MKVKGQEVMWTSFKTLADWKQKAEQAKADNKPEPPKPNTAQDPAKSPHRPSNLFNAMVAPLAGVMIRHGSVAAFLDYMAFRFPLAAGERVLGSTSVCFDVREAASQPNLRPVQPECQHDEAENAGRDGKGTELRQAGQGRKLAREGLG